MPHIRLLLDVIIIAELDEDTTEDEAVPMLDAIVDEESAMVDEDCGEDDEASVLDEVSVEEDVVIVEDAVVDDDAGALEAGDDELVAIIVLELLPPGRRTQRLLAQVSPTSQVPLR